LEVNTAVKTTLCTKISVVYGTNRLQVECISRFAYVKNAFTHIIITSNMYKRNVNARDVFCLATRQNKYCMIYASDSSLHGHAVSATY